MNKELTVHWCVDLSVTLVLKVCELILVDV